MELFVGVQNGFAGQSTHSHRLIIAPTSAMARLLIIAVLAATTHAFKTPKSRALKVRGGIDIQKLGTALIGLEARRGDGARQVARRFFARGASRRWRATSSAARCAVIRWTSSYLRHYPRGIPFFAALLCIARSVFATAYGFKRRGDAVDRLPDPIIAPIARDSARATMQALPSASMSMTLNKFRALAHCITSDLFGGPGPRPAARAGTREPPGSGPLANTSLC